MQIEGTGDDLPEQGTGAPADKPKKAPTVIIYTTPTCPYCRMAKEHLSSKGVSFTEIDVESDVNRGREMMAISGQGGVPVLVINGRLIVGANLPLIDDALTRPPLPRRDVAIQNLTFDIFER